MGGVQHLSHPRTDSARQEPKETKQETGELALLAQALEYPQDPPRALLVSGGSPDREPLPKEQVNT